MFCADTCHELFLERVMELLSTATHPNICNDQKVWHVVYSAQYVILKRAALITIKVLLVASV